MSASFLCFGTIIKINFLCTFLCPTERTPTQLNRPKVLFVNDLDRIYRVKYGHSQAFLCNFYSFLFARSRKMLYLCSTESKSEKILGHFYKFTI